MDKEAFLHQLESAVASNNKNLFIKTIFDLPADVIVDFTKEEFLRINSISRQIDLHDIDELFSFLESEGRFSLSNAFEGIDKLNNSLLGKFYYSLYLSLSGNSKLKIEFVLINNAFACCKLAEMGIDIQENLEIAVSLFVEAQGIFPKKSTDYAIALISEGSARIHLAEMGIERMENLENCVNLFIAARNILPKASEYYASALLNEGDTRVKLGKMSVNIQDNLETAVHLYTVARNILPEASADYTSALISEGNARLKLGEMGINTQNNFETAIHLYIDARNTLPKKSEDCALALANEGFARLKLAEIGVDIQENLEIAVNLYINARNILPKTSKDYARALIGESATRLKLGEIGIDSIENFENIINLCRVAKEILLERNVTYAHALINEAHARFRLAEMGIEDIENLETAISLCEVAKEILPKTSLNYAHALICESIARKILGESGTDSRKNLEAAISLCEVAKEILPETSSSYAHALMCEGSARLKLAEIGIDKRQNLETAICLNLNSRNILSKKSIDYAIALINEGAARQTLAEIDIDSKDNLETAVHLYKDARNILPKTSEDYARALINEGNTRKILAEIGIDSIENLETAVNLYIDAKNILPKTSIDYARALINEGNAREIFIAINVNIQENFNTSKKLYIESIYILQKLGNGWNYSIPLLNLNRLLRNNFYKTGDKKYLEKWERDIGDIEEEIKDRDIRYKGLLRARIYEIRASLLEFDGKSGINKASREYEKAYNLIEDPFYKFMDEFCQARVEIKTFCELVSDWKVEEKQGIFLDYYDYSVFECHLENALRRSIFRKDELESAREKLKEIGNRTQIKIIKDRVSAYVYLMNSLDFCFEKGSYEDAMENVRKACKIFHESDDKPGCEMCECFNEALLENKNPESWRNVVQKIFHSGEFSSNFYRLLCDYSDRKRTTILQDLPLKIIENTFRIEEKVENIQKTLDQISSACVLIKSQIEEGFEGTDAELRQIKEKINSIQKDLGNLVQISNDVGGKEGECIRKFASLMLELMKKGDYEALKRFSEKIVQNSSSIEEIIEAAEIPKEKKVKAKSKLVDLEKIPGILKKTIGNVTENVIANLISGEIANSETIKIVSFASGEIIRLLIPLLSTAILGVPIPSKVVEMLLEAMRDS